MCWSIWGEIRRILVGCGKRSIGLRRRVVSWMFTFLTTSRLICSKDFARVRVYTPLNFQMLSLAKNQRWIDQHSGNSNLAMMFNIDLEAQISVKVWDCLW